MVSVSQSKRFESKKCNIVVLYFLPYNAILKSASLKQLLFQLTEEQSECDYYTCHYFNLKIKT